MSINPITVERLKTFVLLGHSNADGWIGVTDMIAAYPHLKPSTETILTNPEDAWYQNVYVFTSEHPWPGTLGTPASTNIGDGEWLEMCVGAPDTPAMPWPHPSPFVYPNNAGACYPHFYYKGYESALLNGNNGARCGVEIPFQWLWRNHWNEQIGMVKLAFGSSFLLPVDVGADPNPWLNIAGATPGTAGFLPGSVDTVNEGYDYISWWTPRDCFDFAPTTGRFFQRWLDKMEGAQAALPINPDGVQVKMDVRLIINWMGDNDAEARALAALSSFRDFVRKFVKLQRHACVDNDWTTLPESQIPIAWMGVYGTYDNDSPSTRDYINGELQAIAAEDPFFSFIDTSDYDPAAVDGEGSAIDTFSHFGSSGYYAAAEDIYAAWKEMSTEPWDAIAEEDRVTVEEVKDRVLTYYNRARTQTDISDDTLLIHLNGAMNRILNDCGDNAYWLRRRETLALDVGANNVTTMPKYVARVLKIENPSDIKEGLQFQLIGHGDGGRCKIHLLESGSGSYTVHYITRPRDLTLDTELVPIPRQIMEWLVVETVRRLARGGTNIALQGSMEGEARDLRERCLKELQVQQRAKRDKFHTVRRWPTLRYGTRAKRWGNN